jgi:hypothetical protein
MRADKTCHDTLIVAQELWLWISFCRRQGCSLQSGLTSIPKPEATATRLTTVCPFPTKGYR